MSADRRPHSRACGIAIHDHGSQCSPDCPTCSTSPGLSVQWTDTEEEGLRQRRAWIAAAAVERWGMDPNPETLAAMRTAVSGLSPWLAEDVTP